MDPFDDLLRGVRADGALLDLARPTPSGAAPLGEGASLTLCAPLRGETRVADRRVRPGEAAIVRGPEPFRAVGDGVLLTGVYRVRGEVPGRLLRVLPRVVVVPDEHDCAGLLGYLEAQVAAGRPGRQVVLDRLLDWLLVCSLRDWFDRPGSKAPGWYAALADEVVGPALRAMHAAPAEPWTLASLAAEGRVSRTTFAKRFPQLVGEAPLAYLTGWRMALAADMLTDQPATTVATVARRVGYADPFGFSAAFKRVMGASPSAYRTRAWPTAGTTPTTPPSPVPAQRGGRPTAARNG
ncbi:helix-turn-helix transcriptional regulator [Streptomyces sp. SBT349]|uniref:helix-turn-helix transcriptional regulator n=1 Tax=Streptomyces sp. SBT349 TaxID=1580539 RepID=UPI00066E335C|nr:AraC family transcriptional regulator [Streptomyces sp. SBT349]